MTEDSGALATLTTADLADLAPVVERAAAYAAESRSPNTRRAYAVQLKAFAAWCSEHGLGTDDPNATALYLASRADAGASVSTLAQALAAISQAALVAGLPSPRAVPVVRETWAGIRRTRGVAQKQAAPVSPEQLRTMSGALGDGLCGMRDRALLLVGFAAALRRSELVALDVADIQATDDGLVVTVRRSKTDQEGQGRKVGVPYGGHPQTCPVRALRAWLAASGIEAGPVFRGVRHGVLGAKRLHGRDVARIIQRTAARAGVAVDDLSGHSLRAGLATAAAKAGKPAHAIQAQTGHKSLAMVHRYIRDANLFGDNAAAGIGL